MEFLEIFTETGEPTGREAARNDIHLWGWWHQTVHVWVLLEGKLLLQKRSPVKDTHPGLWDVSSAGHIEFGEEVKSAALREMEEELGLRFAENDLRFLFRVKSEALYKEITDREWTHIFLITLSGSPSLNVNFEEVSDWRLFEISDLKEKLRIYPENFVPHNEEYRRLFSLLEKMAINS